MLLFVADLEGRMFSSQALAEHRSGRLSQIDKSLRASLRLHYEICGVLQWLFNVQTPMRTI